jgi:hypothetical protein
VGEKVRQSGYAKRHGLSRQRVHQLKQDGRVVIDEEGLVDVEASDRNLATMIDHRKANMARQMDMVATASGAVTTELPLETDPTDEAPSVQTSGSPARAVNAAADYWTHKALREASEAALSELKLQERLGNLVELREVARATREIYARMANKLLQHPAQLAPVIVSLQDQDKVEVLLLERVQTVLNELASELDQLAAAATAERAGPLQ